MTNVILACSSVVCGLPHVIWALGTRTAGPWQLRIMFLVGTVGAIWNHSVKSKWAKWTDRMIATIGVVVDLVHVNTPMEKALVMVCVGGYLISKKTQKTIPHVCSHVSITLCHHLLTRKFRTV